MKDKKKIRAVVFIVIEMIAFLFVFTVSFISSITYDGGCDDTVIGPTGFSAENMGLTTTFDHDITDWNGNVYPAGTVFSVNSFMRDGYVFFDYVDAEGLSHSVSDILNPVYLSEAENSEELQQIYDQLHAEAEARFQQEYEANTPEPAARSSAARKVRTKAMLFLVITGVVFVVLTIAYNWFLRNRLWAQLLYLPFALVALFQIFALSDSMLVRAKAPIIYLYPEEETVVNVQLELNGELGTTYPHYNEGGWTVIASTDGTLTDTDGREYSYLFWEGSLMMDSDLSQGFCVKGEDTEEFMEWALEELGLNDIEADAFIMYWLPEMEGNQYNVISFQTTAYEDAAALYVTPAPDTEIRVNMLWYSSLVPVDIEEQDLASINPDTREGFTVVEWGGEEYERGLLEYFLK